MITQEINYLIKQVMATGIEDMTRIIKGVNPNNIIEKVLLKDMIVAINQLTSEDYQNLVEETGTFYFRRSVKV